MLRTEETIDFLFEEDKKGECERMKNFEELERLLARIRELQKGNPNAEFHIEVS